MCDTVVAATEGGPVWVAKNSDREPGEAQAVQWVEPAEDLPSRRRCTHEEVAVPSARRGCLLGRPAWMWGAEMGVNDRGVVVANEAVFTRVPLSPTGLTGMDLLRLALEQADSAEHALSVLTGLAARQGGRMGFRDQRFSYHSSFAVADGTEAWILETAGRFWAARRVRGIATMSNVLSIGADYDRVHPDAADHARRMGWLPAGRTFSFAETFADPFFRVATGGHARRVCTRRALPTDVADLDPPTLAAALRDHGGAPPATGVRMQMPCAHASWLPTRWAGQTTGSMIARAGPDPQVWMTGTSSPCLSVFKPVAVGEDIAGDLAVPPVHADDRSLWWRHERLHRAVLGDYARRADAFADARAALQRRAWAATSPVDMREVWTEHHAAIDGWRAGAEQIGRPQLRPFVAFWRWQSRRDGLRG
jgi:dipeptidase